MTVKTKLISILSIGSLLVSGTAFAIHMDAEFAADLEGENEVPPVATNMDGEASLDFNDGNTEVMVKLEIDGAQNLTGAHIHCGAVGANGPIVAHLYGTSSSEVSDITVVKTLMTAQLENAACTPAISSISDLRSSAAAGNLYVNVHNQAYPGGAIRGQLMATHADDDEDDDSTSDPRTTLRSRILALFERILSRF